MNVFGHIKTVTKHRHEVIKNCIRAGIPLQGFLHDMSKFMPTEFIEGCTYYQGTRSPNEAARELNGHSLAWMHHKGRNRHHFEYWTDYSPITKKPEPVKMPLRYVKEMFCDRVAATKIYRGKDYKPEAALEYFMKGKARRIIHKETSDLLEELLVMLCRDGEEKTFAYIRSLKNY